MSTDNRDSDRIGPDLSLADVSLPPAVGAALAGVYGSDQSPVTAAEWVAGMGEAIEAERDRAPTVDDLCTAADGDHTFVGSGYTRSYLCTLDPLAYPFLTSEAGTVRSTTPVRGVGVEFELDADGVAVSHEDALVSVGVASDPEPEEEVTVETVYRQVCPYVQPFEDAAEYELWRETVDAETTAVGAREGVAIARELADVLFDGGRRTSGDGGCVCGSDSGCC